MFIYNLISSIFILTLENLKFFSRASRKCYLKSLRLDSKNTKHFLQGSLTEKDST